MFRLFEFLLGSFLITAFTVASMFFFALHYNMRVGDSGACAWHGFAQTWLDSNGNGRIDAGEPPLSGLEIHVDVPGGYRLTTAARIQVRPEIWGTSGFIR